MDLQLGSTIKLSAQDLELRESGAAYVGPGALGSMVSELSRSLTYRIAGLSPFVIIIVVCLLVEHEVRGEDGEDWWLWLGAGLSLVMAIYFWLFESYRYLLLYENGLQIKSEFGRSKIIYWAELSRPARRIHDFVSLGLATIPTGGFSLLLCSDRDKVKIDANWRPHRTIQAFASWLESSIPALPPGSSIGYRIGRWLARTMKHK